MSQADLQMARHLSSTLLSPGSSKPAGAIPNNCSRSLEVEELAYFSELNRACQDPLLRWAFLPKLFDGAGGSSRDPRS